MSHASQVIDIDSLRRAYAGGEQTPAAYMETIRARAADYADRHIWIHLLTAAEQHPYLEGLKSKNPADHPLWGIPFAIKDNIDLAGIPTTAGCAAFSYIPTESAVVVQRLLDAGAIPVGKTNLDQFATGLNGTRSPWGACANSLNPAYISGGSSSGSAVAVALGLACFSLGTDTAGSGRVPAAFNNLLGVKCSRGLISTRGVVPACRSLDCVTLFCGHSDDANRLLSIAEGFDPADCYSRPNQSDNLVHHYGYPSGPVRIGILADEHLQFFGDNGYRDAYTQTLEQLVAAGFVVQTIDYTPFAEAARLLYEGPWIAERYLATQPLIDEQPEALLPLTRTLIAAGREPTAADLFKATYRLQSLRRECADRLQRVDCLLTPTAGRLFTRAELEQEPIRRNSELGYYTNFMNLLDMAAVAVPTAFTKLGLPFGVTIAAAAFSDRRLLSIANRIQQTLPLPMGALGEAPPPLTTTVGAWSSRVELLVCGAHLSGLALNRQLTERGATLLQTTTTAPTYRLYRLPGGPPQRPALVYDAEQGRAIAVEIWQLPIAELGSFVAAIPAPLGIGKVVVADGREVIGFICEPRALMGADEISHYGGWRSYLAHGQ